MIDIWVPTLGRPGSAQRLVNNIEAATETPHRITFVVEKYEKADFEAAAKTGARVLWNRYPPSYANSIQTAYENTNNPYFIAANDDFEFTEGWDDAALKRMVDPIRVVGIDDGSPNPDYRTIALVDRRYIEEQSGVPDEPNRVFHNYKHNYVDTEFHAVAAARGVFTVAPDAVIRHRHPDWGHVADDSTYRKSRSSMSEDGHTFNERAHLWATPQS